MTQPETKVTVSFEMPGLDQTSENLARVKALIVHAVQDMKVNNGHLFQQGDYALAELLLDGSYKTPEECAELAKEAGVA